MPNIKIKVAGKIATNTTPDVVLVCGNSDYTVTFDLDEEWAAEYTRTARFSYIRDGMARYKEKPFQGNTVAVPKLSGVRQVTVGLYAGDLHTTTAAAIWCKPSVLCGDAVEEITPEEKAGLQSQVAGLDLRVTNLEQNGTGGGSGGNSSNSGENAYNVRAYGAAGDGVTDDTDAITAAIDALPTGGTLYFPAGVYRVSNINLKSDMTVQGDGWCSVIQLLDALTDYTGHNNCLNIVGSKSTPIRNIIVRDIKLDGNRPTQQSTAGSQDQRLDGLHIRYASDIMVENVWMYNNGYHGTIITCSKNVVFERCLSTDNGFRPIHGHTQVYNCRVTNCVCENNGLGLTGGSGYENDSIFFFGATDLVINDNLIKSNRRGCITVGSDQSSTGIDAIVPARNITITGNVCECYEDLPYVFEDESDTGVAKFSSMGILIYGGDYVLENVTVAGNTIRNAHEAIRFYAQENNVCSINAAITGNTVIDCSYGIWAVEVSDLTIANNQFKNLTGSLMYAQTVYNCLIHGNNVNAPGTRNNDMCQLFGCSNIVVQGNHLIGDCTNAVYAPASNTNIAVINNIMSGFAAEVPVLNPNGKTAGNLYISATEDGGGDDNTGDDNAGSGTIEKVCVDPYSNSGFVRGTLVNPNTTSTTWCYTPPVEITAEDTMYELNTLLTIPNECTDPTAYEPASDVYTAVVFLAGTELTGAVGIATLSNGNGTVTFSETSIPGDTRTAWGVTISMTAEKVKELFPTATHVMMQVQSIYKDPDSLSAAHREMSDCHAYVYRSVAE